MHRVTCFKHCLESVQIRSFFWSVFSRIRTEYGEIRIISPYSIRMRENTDQKKLCSWTFFLSERFRSFEKSSSLFYMIYFFAKNYCEVILGNLWLTSFKNSCERMQLLVKMQAAGLMQLYKI